MLQVKYSPQFDRDIKRLLKKRVNTKPLRKVIKLILANTYESREELIQRHHMHTLSGVWSGSNECHICKAGDWLLIWREHNGVAYFQRTGTHNELFRNS